MTSTVHVNISVYGHHTARLTIQAAYSVDQAQLDDDIEHLRELLTELEEAERDETTGEKQRPPVETLEDEMYSTMFATLRQREAEAVKVMMRSEQPLSVVEYERSVSGKSISINSVYKTAWKTFHNRYRGNKEI